MKVFNVTLIAILILGFLLRIYKLDLYPSGFYWDEAAIGYNSYSMLQTGKDEFGKYLPIVFRSFADFKTPLYIYLTTPLLAVFDLSAWSVRLLSAVTGTLSIYLLHLLLKELLMIDGLEFRNKKLSTNSRYLTLTATFGLSISPWHILLSRGAFESNLSLFLFLLSTIFIYKSLQKPIYLIFASVFFGITFISYHAQRLIVPLFLIIFALRYKKEIFTSSNKIYILISLILGILILVPSLSIAHTPGFLARGGGLNIFSNTNNPPDAVEIPYFLNFLLNNRIFLSLKEFLTLYFSYFSPLNLFSLGDSDLKMNLPELSVFYLWQFPFYMIGVFKILNQNNQKELKFFFLSLLLIAPIPASFTRDPFSTIRALPLVIPIVFIISLGIVEALNYLSSQSKKIIHVQKYKLHFYGILFFGITVFSLANIYSSLFILHPHYRSREWTYGYYELSLVISSLNSNLPIVMDNSRGEPYIETLFFLKFNPAKYQIENYEVSNSNYYISKARNLNKLIGNIVTRPIDWEKDLSQEQYFIGDAYSVSKEQIAAHNLEVVKEVVYPDGSLAYIVVRTPSKQ